MSSRNDFSFPIQMAAAAYRSYQRMKNATNQMKDFCLFESRGRHIRSVWGLLVPQTAFTGDLRFCAVGWTDDNCKKFP